MEVEKLILYKIGSRIRDIRKHKKMTIKKLAEISGIQYSHLSKIECGKINTSIKILSTIASALNVQTFAFFSNNNVDLELLTDESIISLIHFSEIIDLSRMDLTNRNMRFKNMNK